MNFLMNFKNYLMNFFVLYTQKTYVNTFEFFLIVLDFSFSCYYSSSKSSCQSKSVDFHKKFTSFSRNC